MTHPSPFLYFRTCPESIRLAVMMYVRYPLSLGNAEDLLHERGFKVSHETVRLRCQRFMPMPAAGTTDTNGLVSPKFTAKQL